MEILLRFFGNLWNQIKSSLPILILIVGIILFAYCTFGEFENQSKHKVFWSGIANVMLTGSLFSFLVKSMQFMGVFKEELIKIIYEGKYLEKRSDLKDIWEKVSKVVFKDKFPKISKEVTKDVIDIYFPTQHVLYYDDYKQIIEIQIVNQERKVIKVSQNSTFNVYPKDLNKFNLKTKNTIKFGDEFSDDASFKIVSIKINNIDKNTNPTQRREDGHLVSEFSIELEKQSSYKCEINIEKTYSLNFDNVIVFSKDYLIHDFNLKITLENPELSIDFYNLGTLKGFTRTKIKNEHIKEFDYKGIIYPKQGYLVFVNLK